MPPAGNFRNILVIKSGALGDLIAGTTALRALRNNLPDARITLLTNSLMNDICPSGILHDEAILFDPGKSSWSAYPALVRDLRRRKFDTAVNLRWSSEGSAYLTLFSGAPVRAGSGPRGSRWAYNVRAPWYDGRRHEFLRHLDIIGALGLHVSSPEPFVHISKEDHVFARNFLEGIVTAREHILAMHPGASTGSKAWPPERYISLGKKFLHEFSRRIIVTWGPGEEALARMVVEGIGGGAVRSPQTTIGRLAALLAGSAMCVCNYSGVMNVGMAVNTPLVALGCTSPEDWGPYGAIHRTVNPFTENDSYTNDERTAAMASIEVDDVWTVLAARWREIVAQPLTVGA